MIDNKSLKYELDTVQTQFHAIKEMKFIQIIVQTEFQVI
jgi:hypothetical protein